MSTFKEKLSKAIKSTYDKFNNMSSEEFQSEIDKFLHDDRTKAVLYAWDSENLGYSISPEYLYDWKELVPELTTFDFSPAKFLPFNYDENQIERTANDNSYKTVSVSDDYFQFMAAA